MVKRYELSDEQWECICKLLPGKAGDPGRTAQDNRRGQVHDIVAAPLLLEGRKAKAVIADTAYDSNAIREAIRAMGAEAVIPLPPQAEASVSTQQAALQDPQPHRTLLQQAQTLQASRHALRSTRYSLPGSATSCRRNAMDALNVDSA
jgi:transposase